MFGKTNPKSEPFTAGRAARAYTLSGSRRALASRLLARPDLARAERVGKARLRRARPQWFLLALMRRPPREPDDVEGRADPAVGIGEALRVDLGHALQRRAAQRRATAL